MKIINKIITALLPLFMLMGCTNPTKPNPIDRWQYDKNDAKSFLSFTALIEEQDVNLKLWVNEEAGTFNDSLNSDNIVLFNKTNFDNETKSSYYSYNEMLNYKINFESFEKKSDGSGFEIIFDGNINTSYAVLVHKDAVSSNNYAFAFNTLENIGSSQVKTQTEFEEQLVANSPGWDDVGTFIDMASYITQMFLGAYFFVPTAFASGLFGYISVLGGTFFGGGDPTTQDVLDKLEIIDEKLDNLSNKIDENQRQLSDQMLVTEAAIDQVLLNQYKQDITEYQTNYILPIENYLAIYKDGIEQAFKAYVSQARTVEFYYVKDVSKNEWVVQSPFNKDVSTFNHYSLEIVTFNNSKSYLSSHGNIVGDGFAEEFIKDIKASIVSMSAFPEGLKKEKMASDIYDTIIEYLHKDFFSDPSRHAEIVNLMTNVKNMANRLAGVSATSAAESYVERLKMMFNFSGEIENHITSLLAGLRDQLDGYLEIAQEACRFAEINCKDMCEAYLNAAEKIKLIQENQKSYDNHYCYFTNSNMYANYFRSYWKISYSNLGNYPTFHASFKSELITSFDLRYTNAISTKEVNIQSLGIVNQTNQKRINTRYRMLYSLGLTEAPNYIEYLVSAGIMDAQGYSFYKDMRANGWVGNDAFRILTSFEIQNMDDSNKNVGMTCTCYGNPDSEYYYIGWKGKYGQLRNDAEYKYWSGKIAVGDFIDAGTCELLNDRRIACYAQYHESHKIWIDDEIFGFVDNPYGNYYFLCYQNAI